MVDPQLLGAYAGHWTGDGTGVTVVLPPPGTVASGEVRGGAPATREFALLEPTRLVDRVDAVVLSGGSAFGLAAGDGVLRLLRERGTGFATPAGPVPIVVGMSIFDASVAAAGPPDPATAAPAGPSDPATAAPAGPSDPATAVLAAASPDADPAVGPPALGAVVDPPPDAGAVAGPPPDALAGRRAALAALSGEPLTTGRAGAGTGATTGKWRGRLDPGGLGRAERTAGPARVAALVVVNAWGDVLGPEGTPVFDGPGRPAPPPLGLTNTTIAVVITDAALTKNDCHLLAQSAHTGFARALHPAHSRYDGDATVALATGHVTTGVDLDRLRAATTEATAAAIRAAVTPAGPERTS
ncbi:P1 family peptidase [Symbioplanes lichenis]|uniref:P1 family peptidase n=1 Tax=Symbioplanes lichenis TaxID=1629072 RepID=UPI0027391194|nr:P1 family peptidase [Actinoplanes lichenis]